MLYGSGYGLPPRAGGSEGAPPTRGPHDALFILVMVAMNGRYEGNILSRKWKRT